MIAPGLALGSEQEDHGVTVGGGSLYRPWCTAQLSAEQLIAALSPTGSPSSPFPQGASPYFPFLLSHSQDLG